MRELIVVVLDLFVVGVVMGILVVLVLLDAILREGSLLGDPIVS